MGTESFSSLFDDAMRQSGSHRWSHAAEESPLELRKISGTDTFAQTVRCLPGVLTVLSRNDEDEFEDFRAALKSPRGHDAISIRYDSRAIHPSEIHVARIADALWDEYSLLDSLYRAGIPDNLVMYLLRELELDADAEKPITSLDESRLRRVAVLCALFSKSRFLLFDNPFEGLASRWESKVASLMAEAAKYSRKIMIVTGVGRIPDAWHSHPHVKVEGRGREKRRKFSLSSGGYEDTISNVRKMMQSTWQNEERMDTLWTRPLAINKTRKEALSSGKLQTEAIENPHCSANDTQMDESEKFGKEGSKDYSRLESRGLEYVESISRRAGRKRLNTGSVRRVGSGSIKRPEKGGRRNRKKSSGSIESPLTSVPWYKKLARNSRMLSRMLGLVKK